MNAKGHLLEYLVLIVTLITYEVMALEPPSFPRNQKLNLFSMRVCVRITVYDSSICSDNIEEYF